MKHTSKSEVYFGRAETIYLIDQEAQSAAFLEVNVKGFLKKGEEKIKMESRPHWGQVPLTKCEQKFE